MPDDSARGAAIVDVDEWYGNRAWGPAGHDGGHPRPGQLAQERIIAPPGSKERTIDVAGANVLGYPSSIGIGRAGNAYQLHVLDR
jgi:hypothetical protein